MKYTGSGSSSWFNNASPNGEASFTSDCLALFRTIPPERIGLNGEYDHNGLAKRVALSLSTEFGAGVLNTLRVTQRGCVVVLVGKVTSQRILHQMVHLALHVEGATDVEIHGVIVESSQSYLDEVGSCNQPLYAC